ncbi:MAG TPA: hypothetical protein VF058_02350 [Actinomycetota bacterium]
MEVGIMRLIGSERRLLGPALVVAWTMALGPQASGAVPGDLDPTFDGDGMRVVDLGGSEESYAVATRRNGKTLIAGTTNEGGDNDVVVIQLTSGGVPDSSFGGGDGVVTTDFFGGYDSAYAVELLPKGKFLVAGQALDGQGKSRFAVARFRRSGTLDTSYGSKGKRTVAFPGNAVALDMVRLPGGSVVLVGASYPNENFVLARLTKGGRVMKSFGKKGRVITNLGGDDGAHAGALQDDRIVVAGGSGTSFATQNVALARYRLGGGLDRTFAGNGKKVVSMVAARDWANDLVVLPNGRIVVVAYASGDIGLARFKPRGGLDRSFGGGDGKVLADFGDDATGQALGRSGKKLVVAGSIGFPPDPAVFRFGPGGGIDGTFGSGGMTMADFGPDIAAAWDVVVRGTKILIAGYTETPGGDIVAARFLG